MPEPSSADTYERETPNRSPKTPDEADELRGVTVHGAKQTRAPLPYPPHRQSSSQRHEREDEI